MLAESALPDNPSRMPTTGYNRPPVRDPRQTLRLALLVASLVCAVFPPAAWAQNPLIPTETEAEAPEAKLEALRAENVELEVRAREWAERAAEFERTQRDAPVLLDELAAEIRAVEGRAPAEVEAGVSPEQLEVMLLGAEQDLSLARKKWNDLVAERDQRGDRRRRLPELLADAKARLAELEGQTAATVSESPEIAEAQATRSRLLTESLDNEIRAYEQELLSFDARGKLLDKRIALARLGVDRADAKRELLQTAVSGRRESEAERAAQEALASLAEADALSPAIRDAVRGLAIENAELARSRTGEEGLIEAIEDTKRKLQRAEARVSEIEADAERLAQRVESSGLSGSVGVLLRKTRSEVPDVGKYRRFIRMRQERIAEVEARQEELREEIEALSDIDALVAGATERLLAESPDADAERIEALLRDLLETKRKHLELLLGDYETYFRKLVDFDARQRELVEKTEALLQYIDERILWIPSGGGLRPKLLRDAWNAFVWLATPRFWGQLRDALIAVPFDAPLMSIAVLLIFFGALPLWRRASRRLVDLAETARKPLHTEIRQSFEAFGLVALEALWGPALLGWLGWRLGVSPDATQFVRCIAQGMVGAAWAWFSLELPRRIVQKDALADAHFGWPTSATTALHRDIGWLIALITPLVFVAQVYEMRGEEAWRESIGSIALVVLFAIVTFFTHRFLREGGPLRTIVDTGESLRLDALKWRFAHLAALAAPVLLAVGTARGYYWTAARLGTSYHVTVVFLFLMLVLLHLAMRWMLLARRRLAFEKWETEQAKQREEAEAGYTGDTEHTDERPIVHEPEIDLATVDAQTSRLLTSTTGLALLLGLWVLWADLVPAIGVVELWDTVETTTVEMVAADGSVSLQQQEQVVPVTLGSVIVALLIVFMTLVVVRNLPGLLEISLFRRLGTQTGERYAYTTIAKYAFILLGGVFAFQTIGVGWSNIQWLVAAVGLGLGFGLQEIFANFVSGLIILFERPIRVGDTVTVGTVSGTVSKIRIRATWITGFDRKELVVPNKEFVTQQLVNWSLTDPVLRVEVPVGIAYGSDTERAMRELLAVADANRHVLRDPKPQVFFLGFGASSLDFELRVFSPDVERRLVIKHELHLAIDRAFRDAGIEIAFPQRDLHLRSVPEAWGPTGPPPSSDGSA